MGHATICKDFTLAGLVVKKNVKCGILVPPNPFVISTANSNISCKEKVMVRLWGLEFEF